MMPDSEWFGKIHTIVVTSVEEASGVHHVRSLKYEIEHLDSCKQELRGPAGREYRVWTCDIGEMENDHDIAYALQYTGTPITEPGTYKIQGWGRKSYVWDYGTYEYDDGIGIVTEDDNDYRQPGRS